VLGKVKMNALYLYVFVFMEIINWSMIRKNHHVVYTVFDILDNFHNSNLNIRFVINSSVFVYWRFWGINKNYKTLFATFPIILSSLHIISYFSIIVFLMLHTVWNLILHPLSLSQFIFYFFLACITNLFIHVILLEHTILFRYIFRNFDLSI